VTLPRRAVLFALLLLAAAALVAHSLVFNFVTDDAFISFVYSRNLAEHGKLVFNLGEHPVEGYTNFLWTVLLAAFMKVGLVPEIMSRVLGTTFAVATFGTAAWMSRRLRPDDEGGDWSWWDALPALILAGVPGYACWSSGGLETQMFAFLVTLGAAWHLDEMLDDRPPRARTGLVFALAALTRPEGSLLFALTVLHRAFVTFARGRFSLGRAELRFVGAFLVLVVPHFLWRRWYYGWWLPNTFYIKSSGVGGAWQQGGYYLGRVVEQFHLWVVPILVFVAFLVERPRGLRLLVGYAALVVTVFAIYVASVGGDFMGLYRFVMPVMPLIAIVAALSLRSALARLATIGKWFATWRRADDYAAVGGAGAQVYYSQIPSLDCYGLSDAYVAHNLPPISTRPGHQKYATDAYILSKHPTIITSGNYRIANGPFVGADAVTWANRGYRYVSVRIPGLIEGPVYSFLLRDDRNLPNQEREP
jgi:hypothetical protein